jgi:aspartyl-tRNA(Asn)/glutamyl-tRNA(Gln) amidotransferase subunit C
MSVDAVTVRRIAHLARIAVDDAEVPHLQGELNAILAFVEQLQEVNVDGVEPMTSVMPMEMKKRADVVNDGGIADKIVGTSSQPFASAASTKPARPTLILRMTLSTSAPCAIDGHPPPWTKSS